MGYFCICMPDTKPISNHSNFPVVLILLVVMFATGVFVGLNSRQLGSAVSNQLPADLNYQLIQEVFTKINANYIKELPKRLPLPLQIYQYGYL